MALILVLGVYFCLVFLAWILAQCLLIKRINNTHCQHQNAFITSTSYKVLPSSQFLDKSNDPFCLKSLAKKKLGYLSLVGGCGDIQCHFLSIPLHQLENVNVKR